jgi:hypothetical protein
MQTHDALPIERLVGLIGYVVAVMLAGVIGLAFLVSFYSIQGYAAEQGAPLPWAIPPLVDIPIVIASLVYVLRSLAGERHWYALFVLVLAGGGTLALNIAHAPPDPGSWAVFGIAPLALVVSVELAMLELRHAVKTGKGPLGAVIRRVLGSLSAKEEGRNASVQLSSGGALAGATTEALDTSPFAFVLTLYHEREVNGGEQLTGRSLTEAAAARGLQLPERDARRMLNLMRSNTRELSAGNGQPEVPESSPPDES